MFIFQRFSCLLLIIAILFNGCGQRFENDKNQSVLKIYKSYIKGERIGAITLDQKTYPVLYKNNKLYICNGIERQSIIELYKLNGEILSYKFVHSCLIDSREYKSARLIITYTTTGKCFLIMLSIKLQGQNGKILCERIFQSKIDNTCIIDVIINKNNIEKIVCQSEDKKNLIFFDYLGKEIFQYQFDKPTLYSNNQIADNNICCYDGHYLSFFKPFENTLKHIKTIELESHKNIDEVLWGYNPKDYETFRNIYSSLYDGKKVYFFNEDSASLVNSFEIAGLTSIMQERLYNCDEGLKYYSFKNGEIKLFEKVITYRKLKPILSTQAGRSERLYYFSEYIDNKNTIIAFSERFFITDELREWQIPIQEDIISYDYDEENFKLALFSENNVYMLDLYYDTSFGGKIIDLRK